MKRILLTIPVFISSVALAQQPNPSLTSIRSGNEFYKNKEYAKASEAYGKALAADPASITAKYNQGNSLFRQDKKVDASILFTEISTAATDAALKAKAFYNKGVILSDQQNLEESIEAYKNTLRIDPTDKEARENLQKALLELKKKKEQKKKEEEKPKKQNEQQKKKQQQPKMNPKEAEQRLKLLQQKEKEVQERVQREKTKTGGSAAKDW